MYRKYYLYLAYQQISTYTLEHGEHLCITDRESVLCFTTYPFAITLIHLVNFLWMLCNPAIFKSTNFLGFLFVVVVFYNVSFMNTGVENLLSNRILNHIYILMIPTKFAINGFQYKIAFKIL